MNQQNVEVRASEPRWPAVVAFLALGGAYSALPPSLLIDGRRWLVPIVVTVLLLPTVISYLSGNHFLTEVLGYILNSVVTLALTWSLASLIETLLEHTVDSRSLLRSGAALWVANILVFASWYWHLDAGGPHQRSLSPGHTNGAFLFPQMTMDPAAKQAAGEREWEPSFIDYLFLAFNTSTAFSPTDVPVLSRWAKIMMISRR
ncbi:MAG: hypothetical protein ACR2LM_18270 [Pyrinomonadaceae bacterium]